MIEIPREFLEIPLILALALIFWANLLILAGFGFEILDSSSLFSVLGVLIIATTSFSIYSFLKQNKEYLERPTDFLKSRKAFFSFMAVLLSLSMLGLSGIVNNVLIKLINFSFRISTQLFFPIKLLYSELFGETLSSLLFNYGRWYLHIVWIYIISSLGYSLVSGPFKSISEKVESWKEE